MLKKKVVDKAIELYQAGVQNYVGLRPFAIEFRLLHWVYAAPEDLLIFVLKCHYLRLLNSLP